MSNKHSDVFVHMIEQSNTIYWLKRCGEDKRNVINKTINFYLKRQKNLSHLTLTSGLSPKERFQQEVSVLEYAHQHHLPTPEVVFKGRSFFVTKNAGEPIHRANPSLHAELFHKAVATLCQFHRKNIIHGRPAMRDIVADEQGDITFLDFEEARLSNSPTLRTRDFLLFLLDSYRLKSVTQEQRLAALLNWYHEFGEGTDSAFRFVESTLSRFGWIGKVILKFRRNRLSKQLLALQVLLTEFEAEKHAQRQTLSSVQ
ncbi:hypothetical protein ACFODT_13580 [Vibrio zhugei]|uniref:Serine/threonine protein kinase n=1 Tax=Vibrio zhugei TaxID=2479546 RepID=A0ABV7CDD5_9VIBR|nr:hypothetical protein [Vibrio zhugei]